MAGLETFGNAIAEVLRGHGPDIEVATPSTPEAGLPCDGLARLLEAAGPDVGHELLERLSSDLRMAERDLIAGLASNDVTVIRSCTHVLIALAGAVGATALQTLVTNLNAAAHRRDTGAFARFGTETLTQLDRLISHVTHEKIRRGDAA